MSTALQELGVLVDAEARSVAQKRMVKAVTRAAEASFRPSVLYRPALAPDGNQWCALYGANLMEGIAGFGDTPELAMCDFDNQFRTAKVPRSAT